MAPVTEFRDDDAGYLAWLDGHRSGYVINISRSYSAKDARVHRADCPTIGGPNDRPNSKTGPYVKQCAERLDELEHWSIETLGEWVSPCRKCRPSGGAARPGSNRQATRDSDRPGRASDGGVCADGDPLSVVGAGSLKTDQDWDSVRTWAMAFPEELGGDSHPDRCRWDGKTDQSRSDWESLVDWAVFHAPAWGRWEECRQQLVRLPEAEHAFEIRCFYLGWNTGSPIDGMAWAARCVALLLSMRDRFEDYPELQETLNELIPELRRWWHGEVPYGELRATASSDQAVTPLMPEDRFHIRGASTDRQVVEAWADGHIRFDGQPDWQKHLRSEIRVRIDRLQPTSEQVLHATFFGRKPANSDVENLALYNIDSSFKSPGVNGIRFEYGASVPPAPDEVKYRVGYRYTLAPLWGTFDHWHPARPLPTIRFDWIELDPSTDVKTPSSVWLALARAWARRDIETADAALAPGTPFAVSIQVRPPSGRTGSPGSLMKSIFDGVISAFQTPTDAMLTDPVRLCELTARLARVVPADPTEIENHLRNKHRAMLGVAPHLLRPTRERVRWNPEDNWCVAGQLLAERPRGECWAIRGEVTEVIPV